MKRLLTIVAAAVLMAAPAFAQPGRVSHPYPQRSTSPSRHAPAPRGGSNSRGGYRYGGGYYGFGDGYVNIQTGLSVSSIRSDNANLDGHKPSPGLFLAVTGGFPLTYYAPVYLETGLEYVEKGGSAKPAGLQKFTYDLNYLEVPLVLKYKAYLTPESNVQPFFGFYMGAGVGGKLKNYNNRQAYSSFESDFRRFDGGLKLGCGLDVMMFHLEAAYEAGLANIGLDDFDETRNRCLLLSVGLTF